MNCYTSHTQMCVCVRVRVRVSVRVRLYCSNIKKISLVRTSLNYTIPGIGIGETIMLVNLSKSQKASTKYAHICVHGLASNRAHSDTLIL